MLCRASTMGRKRSEQGQTDGLGCALVGRQWTGIAFDPAFIQRPSIQSTRRGEHQQQ